MLFLGYTGHFNRQSSVGQYWCMYREVNVACEFSYFVPPPPVFAGSQ